MRSPYVDRVVAPVPEPVPEPVTLISVSGTKVKVYLRRGTAAAVGFLALGLLLWAGALLLIQCTTWLKTGIWHPVPVFAVLLSRQAQTVNLRLTDGIPTSRPGSASGTKREALISFVSHLTPLDLAPSWAAFDSLDGVAARAAWNMVGLARILRSLLDTAFSFWLVTLAFVCVWAMVVLEDSSPTSGTIAGQVAGDTQDEHEEEDEEEEDEEDDEDEEEDGAPLRGAATPRSNL